MANRASQSPDVDGATTAFKRISLGAPTSQLRTASSGPVLRSSSLHSPGMAARRNKPVFKLSDITGEQDLGVRDTDSGPGEGVTVDTQWSLRRSASTPFGNFGKIVYVF